MDKCILTSLAVLVQLWYMGHSKMLKECYKTYTISTLMYHKNMEKNDFKTNTKVFMMSNWESCFMSCCILPYCSLVVNNQNICMHVECGGASQGFCKYRPDQLKENDLHGIIVKHPQPYQSIRKQLDRLQFRNGPSLVTSDMRFSFTQQCAQYVEPENVTGVATSWATKRFSSFSYLYQDNGKEPALGMRSAVPLGGLGTGSFELRADGSFNEWTLENQSPGGSAKLGRGALDLAFLGVRVQTHEGTKASLLRTHPPRGLPGVAGLAYSGGFPVSKLGIEDKGFFGLKLELFAYSSIKARSAVDSALPAVIFSLRIRNPTSNRAEVSLLLNLPLGEQPDTARKGGDFKVIQNIPSAAACAQLCRNSRKCMAWSLVKTSCSLKDKMPLHAYKQGVTSGVKNHWVRKYGRLTCTRPGNYPNSGNTTIMWVANNNGHHNNNDNGYYDRKQRNKRSSNMAHYSNGGLNYKPDGLTYANNDKSYYYNNYYRYFNKESRTTNTKQQKKPNTHKITFSSTVSDDIDLIWQFFAKYGHLRNVTFKESGIHGSAAGKISLGPGEEGTITLVMSWFYPYRDHAGEYVGQYYRNIFTSSEDVAFHTKQNLPKILDELQSWRDNMTPSNTDSEDEVKPSLPDWLQDMLVNSLSSWRIGFWVADGRWRQWETFDCNDVDSVHNDFQRELPFILFFPGLLENVVRAWGASQHEGGLILEALQGQYGCWSKTNKLDTVGGRYNMADVNPAFITQVYHLYKWAGKEKLLQELWPAVRKATIWMIKGATEGTGIPFRMTNTYDILQLQNYDHSFYNCVMYLLGLRAAEEMAEIQKDDDLLFLVRDSIVKARRLIDALFWDEERGYYHAWWDREKGSPPWLMADSLYGQVWAYTLGLGDLLPVAKMRSHLEKEGVLNDTPYGLQVVTKNNQQIQQKTKRELNEYETADLHGPQYPYMWTNINLRGQSFNNKPGIERHQITERHWAETLQQPRYFYSSRVEQYRPPSENVFNQKVEYSPHLFTFYANSRPAVESNSEEEQDVDRLVTNDVMAQNSYINGYYSNNNNNEYNRYNNDKKANTDNQNVIYGYDDTNDNDDYQESNHQSHYDNIMMPKDDADDNTNSSVKGLSRSKISRHTKCSLLHKDLMFESIWMGASPDWTTLQIHLGLDPSKALEQARKSLNHYRTKLKDLWNIHGLTAGSGHGLDGQPWCTSHYTFHMVLWHIPIALSGQQYSIIERALQFNPKLRIPYSLPFFVPYASGTVEAVRDRTKVLFTLTVTHGYLVLKQLSISGVDWPGSALKLEKGESTTWS